jgi:SPP1 gp7 family putative phage head morphogenesis protein
MNEDLFSLEFISNYLLGIYHRIFTKEKLSLEYHAVMGNELEAGVNDGYGGKEFSPLSLEQSTHRSLKENVWIFSAAKQYQQVRHMSSLISESSNFTDFKKEAMKVWDEFNKNYLKTEYNTAVGQSQMARDWVRSYEQRETLPMMTYHTQRDSHVRDEHAILDGITLPVTDKFWNTYMPKNGWNCRCFTTQNDNEKTDLKSRDLSELNDEKKFPPVFRMNPGKDGIVFSHIHPYFKVARGDKELKDNNFNLPIP